MKNPTVKKTAHTPGPWHLCGEGIRDSTYKFPGRKTRAAIAKYGEAVCRQAYDWHVRLGYGASGIANEMSGPVRTTRQADAAINAGRELAGKGAF